ncbi:aminoglycoside resistance protein [Gordonia jinghuaiqii]|uniref:Fructosamine kinase family protein n=1 Tax=Gordonia jinghuaiqii TaxID=2758710 RepID=A0A7D7LXB3_9ACTN|nr:aminoglycoside phosphotransferase family protein [Gordonia jinghuaiqii]MCR5979224.1 aminoglycoside resistance protein [Gordonia jinghuaiqii]QMT01016.1 fructosamine kinase family protein [Gordonia jinghuaiqii]
MIADAEIPPGLRRQETLGPRWQDWLDRLPRTASGVLAEWELRREGTELWHGFESLVIPVTDRSGYPTVLKLAYDGDDEGAQEALGLQQWGGVGAVRMLRADPRRRALLLERLERRDLTSVDDAEACVVVADLYGALHVPAPGRMTHLTAHLERWLTAMTSMPRDAPVPRRFVEQSLSLGRDFLSDDASTGVVIHGDLHHENVLMDGTGRWLAIDPKPMSGDRHYELAPMLWNRLDHYHDHDRDHTGIDVRDVIRHRFHTIVDAAGLDPDRARDWAIVRMILNAHWAIEDADRVSRALTAADREWITTCITVAKAVIE